MEKTITVDQELLEKFREAFKDEQGGLSLAVVLVVDHVVGKIDAASGEIPEEIIAGGAAILLEACEEYGFRHTIDAIMGYGVGEKDNHVLVAIVSLAAELCNQYGNTFDPDEDPDET